MTSVVVGTATENLERLIEAKTEPFDLIFIDADKKNNPTYLQLSLKLSRPGTIIIGDNVVREGRVNDFSACDPDIVGTRQFIDLLGTNPHLETTVLQTVGIKGWDGFSITLVSG
jgi:predicted O-methyltransferase YrrM